MLHVNLCLRHKLTAEPITLVIIANANVVIDDTYFSSPVDSPINASVSGWLATRDFQCEVIHTCVKFTNRIRLPDGVNKTDALTDDSIPILTSYGEDLLPITCYRNIAHKGRDHSEL